MTKIDYLIVVDTDKHNPVVGGACQVVNVKDYILGNFKNEYHYARKLKVINLCSDFRYLHNGYYCSLLAEARGHKVIPRVTDIVHARWKKVYKQSLPEVQQYLDEIYASAEGCTDPVCFFFGRTNVSSYKKLGRKLFEIFRLPMMSVSFEVRNNALKISGIEPVKLSSLNDNYPSFEEFLNKYIGSYWSQGDKKQQERYWLAILHDKSEKYPPSNSRALDKFIKIGKKKRFFVELITKNNFDSLLEYDALFIRTTTKVNHYTYHFAQKAFREDIPCVDDKESIVKCCNKVYLQELISGKHYMQTPKTRFVTKAQALEGIIEEIGFPIVLKIPDGSFSKGVFKVENQSELQEKLKELFKQSELILMQEFIFSEYDWRIVVLDNKPLFACKYFMAKKHWQIYNHSKTSNNSGRAECVAIEDVPKKVMDAAIKSTSFIGSSLYGVDIKEVGGKPYVIEINDNPNIDAGIEDRLEGDKIYEAIFDYFEKLINA